MYAWTLMGRDEGVRGIDGREKRERERERDERGREEKKGERREKSW